MFNNPEIEMGSKQLCGYFKKQTDEISHNRITSEGYEETEMKLFIT